MRHPPWDEPASHWYSTDPSCRRKQTSKVSKGLVWCLGFCASRVLKPSNEALLQLDCRPACLPFVCFLDFSQHIARAVRCATLCTGCDPFSMADLDSKRGVERHKDFQICPNLARTVSQQRGPKMEAKKELRPSFAERM